ncbi:MAG: ABC transporter permease [Gaiellaceae bacterium]
MRRAYLMHAKLSLQEMVAYRGAFFVGLLGNLFFLLSMFYLWHVLLKNPRFANALGWSWSQMKAYLLIGFVAGTLVSTFTDWTMSNRIRTGDVALDLARPIDYQKARFSEALGVAVFELATAILVGGLVVAVFGGMTPPTLAAGLLFAVSLALVVPLKFGVIYMSGLVCFWTTNYLGVSWSRQAVANIMSGALVPIVLFPGWLQALANALPFQAMVWTPGRIYLGTLHGAAAVEGLLIQAAWGIGLWLLARLMWRLAVRKLVIQGG